MNLEHIRNACRLILLTLLFYSCGETRLPKPKAVDGFLDLQHYDLAAHGPVALDGAWEFHYGKFLSPQDFKQVTKERPIHIPVPDSWNHHGFAAAGFATYRLRIRLPPKFPADELLSLRLDTAGTAYILFVNGREVATAGKPGTTLATSRGSYKVQTIPVHPERGELELVFHISNYFHRSGGLWFSHHLGTPEAITRMREKGLFADFILMGALFIIGFYHISLFLNRRRELPVLHFGLFCLIVAFRVPFTGEFFLTQLFPDFALSLQLRLEYATVYITPVFIISFIAHSYAEKTRKFILYYSRIVAFFFCLTFVFLPSLQFTSYIVFHDLFLMTIVIWAFSIMIAAVVQKRENAAVSLFLLVVLAATLINDLLFSLEYVYTTSMLPFGLILFVFAQAVLLSRKFYQAFKLSENLSATLTVTNRDLTQLKENLEQKVGERTEVLREKNDELALAINTREKFLSILAHDLRSPLVGMARILEARQLEQKMIPALAKTAHECVDLLENMLNWALSQKNQLKIFADDIDLVPVLKKILNLIEHTAEEKKLRLVLDLPGELWVHVDNSMIETVLRNLIGNAVKFTPAEGEVSITGILSAENIRIEIVDNGPGITAERSAMLFAPANTTRKAAAPLVNEGTGLGLIICKEFIEANGGTIGVSSIAGQGSRFWFEIPRGLSRALEEAYSPAATNFKRLKALLVEDNAVHMRLAESVLAELGISAEMANDGQTAWNLLRSQQFDFILLDVKIPLIDGFTLAAKMAALEKKPRVIFHSSFSEGEISQQASAQSYDAVLPKPLDKDALTAILARFYDAN